MTAIPIVFPDVYPDRFYVYTHSRTSDGRIFYVGKGKGRRAWTLRYRNPHWLNVAAKHGVTVTIVQQFDYEIAAYAFEYQFIADCQASGLELTNRCDGGRAPIGVKPTAEQRAARSAKMMGWKFGPPSAEHRRRISEALKGKPVPLERRAKIAAATAAAMRDPAIVAKMRDAKLGKKTGPKSVETRAKISAAHMGKTFGADTRARMSAGNGGRPVRCIETGQVFAYAKLAAPWIQSLGYKARKTLHIYEVCRGEEDSAYGYHWEYAT